jgi:hypothetical protein
LTTVRRHVTLASQKLAPAKRRQREIAMHQFLFALDRGDITFRDLASVQPSK